MTQYKGALLKTYKQIKIVFYHENIIDDSVLF